MTYPTESFITEEFNKLSKVSQEDQWIWRYGFVYLKMAAAGYRPCAPSDGCGNIQLDDTAFMSRDQLWREAFLFGIRCLKQEDYECAPTTLTVYGVVNGTTGAASRLAIEAATVFNGGSDGDELGIKLLRMALDEAERKVCEDTTKARREELITKALNAHEEVHDARR
jgi:hypothetical protein